ncbi:hypothetical protein Tco_1387858 [Tanacetum coccineum]
MTKVLREYTSISGTFQKYRKVGRDIVIYSNSVEVLLSSYVVAFHKWVSERIMCNSTTAFTTSLHNNVEGSHWFIALVLPEQYSWIPDAVQVVIIPRNPRSLCGASREGGVPCSRLKVKELMDSKIYNYRFNNVESAYILATFLLQYLR